MADQDPVRVALLNDHSLVVEGLAAMLRPYPDRIQVTDVSAQAPIEAACDIALFDTFGSLDPQAHWSDFVGEGWSPRYVVVYSWHDAAIPPQIGKDAPPAVRVSKALDGEALVDALEQIYANGTYQADAPTDVDDAETQDTAQDTPRRWPGQAQGLTERESEIVSLIVEGLSNQDIADRLFLGINTIKTYIRTAYGKMGVTSRSNAVLWGIDHGFRRQRPPR